ncbi:MAG: HAMP domain-containing histidine kinase [Clostridia bacterium]|nr:HAMP domain-containing histidine kinase [Clostridia bacterium]
MTEKKKSVAQRILYSLRSELLLLILVGAVIASGSYFLVHSVFTEIINRYYLTEEAKSTREIDAVMDLQTFIQNESITSDDVSRIGQWQERNRYIYLLIYNAEGDVVYTSDGGMSFNHDVVTVPFPSGITVEVPREEELRYYAGQNTPYPLYVGDGALSASVADFTEYLYYDIANIISLLTALVALALIMIFFVRKIVLRITRLASDVSVVAEGKIDHRIRMDEESDEISNLIANVENMRTSLISTLEREREAINANNELITSMSHDIRTPLTVLLGYLDLMKSRTDDEIMKGYLATTESTALRLKELSDDLFQYFTVFSNKDPEVSMSEYDAETLFDQLITEHVLLLSERGFDMHYRALSLPDGKPAEIVTDVQKFCRITDNLFSNIGKYADKNSPINIDIYAENGNICLHAENKIKRNTEEVESNGIGLRTCERLCKVLNGTFAYEEKDGCFLLTLTVPMKNGGQSA